MRMAVAVGAVSLVVGWSSSPAWAAGFALKEQSAKAQGNAFAGATAGAESLSYMFFNPAALGRFDGALVELDASAVIPTLELEDASAQTTAGVPIAGRTSKNDAADNAIVPAFYAMVAPTESLRFGLGINAPFGLGTEYPNDWVGRYHTTEAKLTSININPATAWRATDWLTLGAGLQLQWTEAELINAIDFGTLGAGAGVPGAVPTTQDGRARVKGDDWAVGFNLGVLAEPVPGTRIGAAYRSAIDSTLKGDAWFRLDEAGIGAALQGATGAFQNVDAKADVELPPMASFGIHQDINDSFAVMGEVQWTGWSTLDELVIEFDNPAQADNVNVFDWDDSWFFAVGATWKPTDRLALRVGGAFDQSPVRNATRTPRIPDTNRWWLSTGLGWEITDALSLDVAYTHIFLDDADIRQRGTERGNLFRGDLDARYESAIDLISVAVSWRF